MNPDSSSAMPTDSPSSVAVVAVAVFDARPFLEQVLVYGVQHGILDKARLDSFCADAPKGIVQIARYFGSEFLRPDLEQARIILVHLVSLCLQDRCHGDFCLRPSLCVTTLFCRTPKGEPTCLRP